jgi:hypothetical protein
MGIEIVPYLPAHEAAVRRFHQRLAAAGADPDMRFPEPSGSGWMPGTKLWLAVEDDEVRGGYILRPQAFSFGGETHQIAHYRLPLSEGLVNRAYTLLAVRLVRDALNREAQLYALGMGGWEKPLPEMLKRLNWRMAAVPFHFKAPHPYRFLRQIRALRSSAFGRLACDAAAFSGAGWLALWLAGVARRSTGPAPLEAPASFAGWADAVWESCRPRYAMAAVRDAATLDRLYPPADPRFLRVRAAGGWAVLLDTAMRGHKQFGDLRVGTIVDSLAPPEDAAVVVLAAARILEERGVDLIVSNQLHHAWSSALAKAGFRQAPTNFLIAMSPALAARMEGRADQEIHMNRGDGDGPIHL